MPLAVPSHPVTVMRATPLRTRAKVSAHWGLTGGAGVVGPPVGTAVPLEGVEDGVEGAEGVEGGVEGAEDDVGGGDATGGGAFTGGGGSGPPGGAVTVTVEVLPEDGVAGVQPTRVADRTPAASAATGR